MINDGLLVKQQKNRRKSLKPRTLWCIINGCTANQATGAHSARLSRGCTANQGTGPRLMYDYIGRCI